MGRGTEMGQRPLVDRELEAVLAELPGGLDAFAITARLRKQLGPERGRIAAELHELRTRALKRFPSGRLRFLTRKGLEQATPERVAAARGADFVQRAKSGTILDATCGLGADSLGLAAHGAQLVSADRDPELAMRARANLRAAGHAGHVIVADAARPALTADWLLCDPDRRIDGRRSMSPAEWSPTLADCLRLAARCRGAAIKLPPAYDPSRHPDLQALAPEACVEWTSLDGSLIEAVMWLGELAEDRPRHAARVLRGQDVDERVGGDRESIEPLAGSEAHDVAWIADPDPALIRAGQLERVARAAGLRPLARELAYLGGPVRVPAPGLAYHRVIAGAPLDRKKVRAMLAAHEIGPLTVKKRGHSDSAEALAARHARKEGRRGTLIVARLDSGHRAYLVERAPSSAPAPGGGVVGDEGFEPPTSSL
jgi:SAM-dependent methyltransferase